VSRRQVQSDDELFRTTMSVEGVRPIPASPARLPLIPKTAPPSANVRRVRRAGTSDAAAYAPIADAISSGGPLLELERAGELVSARALGVDKRTLRKLAAGELGSASAMSGRFARLDLHGEKSRLAEERVLRFILAARADGQQVVAVVHGRGLHSGQEGPVLKEVVLRLLTEGAVRDHVLALASAPARLGGPGVTLVLLRTKR